MATRLDSIEQQILELWKERDKAHAEAIAAAERQDKLAAQKAEARKVLPELREREREAWQRYADAVHELQAAIEGLDELRPEFGRAFANLRNIVPAGMRTALKRELSRLSVLGRKARDAESIRKRQAEHLRDTAKRLTQSLRKLDSVRSEAGEQGRRRINTLLEQADTLERRQAS